MLGHGTYMMCTCTSYFAFYIYNLLILLLVVEIKKFLVRCIFDILSFISLILTSVQQRWTATCAKFLARTVLHWWHTRNGSSIFNLGTFRSKFRNDLVNRSSIIQLNISKPSQAILIWACLSWQAWPHVAKPLPIGICRSFVLSASSANWYLIDFSVWPYGHLPSPWAVSKCGSIT